MTIPSVTDDLLAEIEAAAKVFDNLDFDSNTNPFFNGPSGESMGGEADGTFCVYGEPFEIDGEAYDGVTFVERCSRSQARFIAESKQNVLALIARIKELEDAQRWVLVSERLPAPGLLVQVYSPPQPGDWPDTVRIDTDGIDPESEDYWVGHGEHYEHYCMIAKGGDVEWTGPAEKAPYTHWKPMPEPPA